MSGILTARQAEVLAYIDGRGIYPPTLGDICERFGIRSKHAAHTHVIALERKGFVRRDECDVRPGYHTARGLVVISRRDGDRVLLGGVWYRFIPAAELFGEQKGECP